MTAPGGVRVREAIQGELPAVLNVLDGGGLATDHGRLERALARGDVLVAVAGDAGRRDRVLGVLALEGEEITAVAVRRRRRGQGIGTALVEAAGDRRERLRAGFDARVRPFWESLAFAVEPAGDRGRYRGTRPAEPA